MGREWIDDVLVVLGGWPSRLFCIPATRALLSMALESAIWRRIHQLLPGAFAAFISVCLELSDAMERGGDGAWALVS